MSEASNHVAEITNPRRALFLGGSDSGVITLLRDLTGSAPEPLVVPAGPPPTHALSPNPVDGSGDSANDTIEDPQHPNADAIKHDERAVTTVAGLTHVLNLRTKYYNATIPIWIDEPHDTDTWREDFVSPDAGEVVRAVGAWVIVFREEQARRKFGGAITDGGLDSVRPSPAPEGKVGSMVKGRDGAARLMRGVRDAIEVAHGGPGVWDGACLAIGMPTSNSLADRSQHVGKSEKPAQSQDEEEADEAWEDLCYDLGFEYIDCSATHGSTSSSDAPVNGREKMGVQRVLEALETCDWENIADGEVDIDGIENVEDETLGFGLERAQLEAEFVGLKTAMSAAQDEEGSDLKAGDGNADEEAIKVEELERMMHKMSAVRDMSADMPEQERRRLAAKTVNEIMKTI